MKKFADMFNSVSVWLLTKGNKHTKLMWKSNPTITYCSIVTFDKEFIEQFSSLSKDDKISVIDFSVVGTASGHGYDKQEGAFQDLLYKYKIQSESILIGGIDAWFKKNFPDYEIIKVLY